MEFGSGWSTIVIAHALNINKKHFFKKILKKKIRFNNPFEHYVLENEKKFLNITKKRTKSYLKNSSKLSIVFLLIDSRIKPQNSDIEFSNFIGKNKIPMNIILFRKSPKAQLLVIFITHVKVYHMQNVIY